MASIKRRRGKYYVVYYYFNEDGEKKQKWESYDTESEAKHRHFLKWLKCSMYRQHY